MTRHTDKQIASENDRIAGEVLDVLDRTSALVREGDLKGAELLLDRLATDLKGEVDRRSVL